MRITKKEFDRACTIVFNYQLQVDMDRKIAIEACNRALVNLNPGAVIRIIKIPRKKSALILNIGYTVRECRKRPVSYGPDELGVSITDPHRVKGGTQPLRKSDGWDWEVVSNPIF